MHRWLLVISSWLLISGCGFGIAGPDPDRPRSEVPKCDTGKGMVALDGVMAGVSGLVALSIAGETEPAVALLPLAIGSIYVAGAFRGNSNANKCRAAMGQWESYMAARDTLPPGYANERPRMPPMRPPAQQPMGVEPDEGPPPVVAPPAPALAPPVAAAPAAQQQPQQHPPAPARSPQGRPAPPPRPEPADDWSEFWREVD